MQALRDKRAIDPKADALLMSMSKALSGMKSFSFESEQVYRQL
jgi:hypothetical protein